MRERFMTFADARTAPHESPRFRHPNFERMPPELKEQPNWVLWVPIWSGSKWTKRPIQISGYGASTTNQKHWSTFDQVRQAYDRAIQEGGIEIHRKGGRWSGCPSAASASCSTASPTAMGLFWRVWTSTRSYQAQKLP